MAFDKVVGQDSVKQTLLQMNAAERMPHALLLLGAEGSGGLPLALALGQYLLCQQPTEDDACGVCPSCVKASKFIHPDLHFVFPTIGAKAVSDHYLPDWRKALAENPYLSENDWLQFIFAENKQGNITKNECENIVKKLSLKTFESSKKVLILWLPEKLGNEGNRLLKIIEEPPENTHFILVAQNQELILNTILSRCQIVKVSPLSNSEIATALQSRGVTGGVAESISHLADGNYNEALKLSQNTENNHPAFFVDWLRKCYRANGLEIMPIVNAFAGLGRENQKQLFQYGLHFMREYLTLRVTGSDQRIRLKDEELNVARNMTKVLGFEQVNAIVDLLTDCAFFIERNANPKILFLDTSIQMHKILKNKK